MFVTTTIKIDAHCADDTQVEIQIATGSPEGFERVVIQDGESHELHVYDEREVTIREVKKP